jgi:hypothetical protein
MRILYSSSGCDSLSALVNVRPNWVKETSAAAWKPRILREFVFKDRLWILGGWFNSLRLHPVMYGVLPDGRTWTEVTAAPGFTAISR